ncbi:MAG TPA: glycosyltransferase [Bryobacteraceae bacterium]|nr:glycosyltransferase [Bryobacteraceae bacterium]
MLSDSQVAFWYKAGRLAGLVRPRWRRPSPLAAPQAEAPPGISLVIPSRNGRELLAAQFPGIVRELASLAHEILVVDNGSTDATEAWLHSAWPAAQVDVSPAPLSFAAAVNRGIRRARYSHICLLNNDMLLEPGFFAALWQAFERVPGLFCATAQIRFPPGVRREETGKAVMRYDSAVDFPVRCDEPLPGEDLTYVLYGSGGCSLYHAAMLRQLGGMDEAYAPVYVEDLDIGYRGWQRGWPSVYVAGAVLEHRHRATSSRYFTEEQLEEILEVNYLRFLARAIFSPSVFRRLWKQALVRLLLRAGRGAAPRNALRKAAGIALRGGPSLRPRDSEEMLLALTDGSLAVFPGRAPGAKPRRLIAAALTAVRPSADCDQIVVTWVDKLAPPPPEVLAEAVEVVVVQGHEDSPSFRAARRQTAEKWMGQGTDAEARRR